LCIAQPPDRMIPKEVCKMEENVKRNGNGKKKLSAEEK
jgi:hypothetical protein